MAMLQRDNHDGVSISRATSISRTSKAGSTVSRNQSLIKKNIAPHDLRPSDILIERFTAWKMIIKQLIGYFEGLAEVHANMATSLTKLSGHIQVPFRTGNQFLGEDGIQDVYYSIRDKTRSIADQHAGFAKTLEGSIVGHLHKLRAEIKAHIKNIRNDTGKLATVVARERELSTKLISELAKNIAIFKNTPMSMNPKDDPYVANTLVQRQLVTQVHAENALQKSIIIIQNQSSTFEAALIQSMQSAHATFADWNTRTTQATLQQWNIMAKNVQELDGEREWLAFAGREDHLIDPDTPLRNPETIQYPSKADPSVIAIQSGWMERKKRLTRTYKERYFVLTPAGYLHEFESSDPNSRQTPVFSLFLPACTLGPPSAPSSKSHKFHIETNPSKDSASTASHKSLSIFSRGGGTSYTFRCRSHSVLLEWWNDLRMLCKRYLVATEAQDRSGPVTAAVRAAGYISEGEDEDEDDEEGSSVEEDEEGEDRFHSSDNLPTYSNAAGISHPMGYPIPIEKKKLPGHDSPTHDQQQQHHRGRNGAHSPISTELMDGHGRGVVVPNGATFAGTGTGAGAGVDTDGVNGGVGAGVVRRPSKRQQEKAPEGKEPRMAGVGVGVGVGSDPGANADTDDEAGPAPLEASRFREGL